ADVRAHALECCDACKKLGSCGDIVGTYDDGGTQTMPDDKLGVVRKNVVKVARRLPTICK
ncbi:MAG: hypothetical protein WA706_13440, partial [Pseudolabrys sp.]